MTVWKPAPMTARAGLTAQQFEAIRSLIHRISGIELRAGKEGLVQSRLGRRLRALDLPDFDAYLEQVRADRSGRLLSDMVDAMTTNETSFFRETRHFDVLRSQVLPALLEQSPRVRVWSAGCSTGEEPFTLALVLRAALAGHAGSHARILATDLSAEALKRARAATYDESQIDRVPDTYRSTGFRLVSRTPRKRYQVVDELRATVHFARLNLMDHWPMRRPMDVIFCRNVMIYFDRPTQERLIARFTDALAPGGYLFVGHSESLSGFSHGLRYVQPSVYAR